MAGDSKKNDKGRSTDSTSTSTSEKKKKKRKGPRKGKGFKEGASFRQPSSSSTSFESVVNKLEDLLKSVRPATSSVQVTCRGLCWKCGRPGHRKAECPGGKVCSLRADDTHCPKGNGACRCDCTGHTHFGYGEDDDS